MLFNNRTQLSLSHDWHQKRWNLFLTKMFSFCVMRKFHFLQFKTQSSKNRKPTNFNLWMPHTKPPINSSPFFLVKRKLKKKIENHNSIFLDPFNEKFGKSFVSSIKALKSFDFFCIERERKIRRIVYKLKVFFNHTHTLHPLHGEFTVNKLPANAEELFLLFMHAHTKFQILHWKQAEICAIFNKQLKQKLYSIWKRKVLLHFLLSFNQSMNAKW